MSKTGDKTTGEEPFDWHQPAKDVHGNIITPDDPKYMEKLSEATRARMVAELTKPGGARDKLRAYEASRSTPINERLSECHTLQEKARILLESLDRSNEIFQDHEALAILPELERIRDTSKGKPTPVPYEMYQDLSGVISRLREAETDDFFVKPYSDFMNLLVQTGLIATSPQKGASAKR